MRSQRWDPRDGINDFTSREEGFPAGSDGKESACQCRRCGFDPRVGKIPWRREWQPTPVFLLGEAHGLSSLVGYSPWGRKESSMPEQLNQRNNYSKAEES